MALKTGILSLSLGALLLGSTALAADTQAMHHASSPVAQDFRGPSRDNDRYRRPQPPSKSHGRYELKRVKKWVPGQYQQVWVANDCSNSSHRYIRQCEGGSYQRRWVPGHYEMVEEWVWVPASRGYGRRPA